MLFITNHITDALSDLSWTAVLVRAEPCVENRSVRVFSANCATPSVCVCVCVWKWKWREHTPGAVGSHLCCGALGAFGGSVPCSRAPQSWYWRWRERCTFTPPTYNSCRPETRTRNLWIHYTKSLESFSCGTEDWCNGCWKFSFVITELNYILACLKKQKTVILILIKFHNITVSSVFSIK